MPAENMEQRKMVLREISKRHIDTTLMDVHVMHGVVYLRGTVRKIRGHDFDLKAEMELIRRILRQKPEIRDVVLEVIFR
jgi:hypothetical protein